MFDLFPIDLQNLQTKHIERSLIVSVLGAPIEKKDITGIILRLGYAIRKIRMINMRQQQFFAILTFSSFIIPGYEFIFCYY